MLRTYAVPSLILVGVALAAVAMTVGCGVTPGDGLAATPTHYTVQYDISVDPGTGEMSARLVQQQTRNVEAGVVSSPIKGPLTCKMTNYGAAWVAGSPVQVNAKFSLNHDIKLTSTSASCKLTNIKVSSEFPPVVGTSWLRIPNTDDGKRTVSPSPLLAGPWSDEFEYKWQQNTAVNPTGPDGIPYIPLGFILLVEFDATAA